jgi:hypothetical protein
MVVEFVQKSVQNAPIVFEKIKEDVTAYREMKAGKKMVEQVAHAAE